MDRVIINASNYLTWSNGCYGIVNLVCKLISIFGILLNVDRRSPLECKGLTGVNLSARRLIFLSTRLKKATCCTKFQTVAFCEKLTGNREERVSPVCNDTSR